MESGHPTACEVLGHDPVGSVYTGRPHPIAEAAATASPQRATQLTLAVLLGAAEDATNRQTWRSPESGHRAYFTALRDWGYPLSPVEQLVLPDPHQPGDDRDDADSTNGSGVGDGAGQDAGDDDGAAASVDHTLNAEFSADVQHTDGSVDAESVQDGETSS
ncbi:hypothetical protein ACVGOW_19700 [Pseudonocardia saturnea]